MSLTYIASGPSQPPKVGDLFSELVEASAIAPHLCGTEVAVDWCIYLDGHDESDGHMDSRTPAED